jgi:hypothetical protein
MPFYVGRFVDKFRKRFIWCTHFSSFLSSYVAYGKEEWYSGGVSGSSGFA